MAKAPSGKTAANFDGSGAVWFKVYQITAVTNGGSSITFPAENLPGVSFTVPRNLPSGDYLVRMEAIALHAASTFGGAQFYVSYCAYRTSAFFLRYLGVVTDRSWVGHCQISCGQVTVTGGGSGNPGPLVSIPG